MDATDHWFNCSWYWLVIVFLAFLPNRRNRCVHKHNLLQQNPCSSSHRHQHKPFTQVFEPHGIKYRASPEEAARIYGIEARMQRGPRQVFAVRVNSSQSLACTLSMAPAHSSACSQMLNAICLPLHMQSATRCRLKEISAWINADYADQD
jgi:hypothetical protein